MDTKWINIQKMHYLCLLDALVLELVDKRDLKSLGQKCPYGFDSRPEHAIQSRLKSNFGPAFHFRMRQYYSVKVPASTPSTLRTSSTPSHSPCREPLTRPLPITPFRIQCSSSGSPGKVYVSVCSIKCAKKTDRHTRYISILDRYAFPYDITEHFRMILHFPETLTRRRLQS